MARTLLAALRAAISRFDMLVAGDTVLVAVSGGADSVALLAALVELREALKIEVVAGHLDHGLRGSESEADRAFVERLAVSLGVRLRSERVRLLPGNTEAEARRARYDFLERAASALGATKIATAHTVDDQAETVLLRLLRGAGRRGLGGIRPRRGRIIRPLILCDRVQVRQYLVERRLTWRRDRSNFDLAFFRTRLRFGYLPALTREFNPRLSRTLSHLADLLREEDALLDRLAAAAATTDGGVEIAALRALEAPLARRAVRRWWHRHGSGRRLGRVHVEAVLGVVSADASDAVVRVPGGTIERGTTELRFRTSGEGEDAGAPNTTEYAFALAPDGDVIEAPGGWRLWMSVEQAPNAVSGSARVCVVDADQVPPVLEVRSRRPGDRMRPLGLAGHTTIKRLFIARRVPRAERASHPIVVAGGQVLWVPGCARSDRALVTAMTRRALVIHAEKK